MMQGKGPDGGIGRRDGLKIRFPQGSVGSTPSPGTTYLRGGTVVVTTRPRSPYWQARLKQEDGRWRHCTLDTTDHTEACARALAIADNPHSGRRSKTSFAHYASIMGDRWKQGSRPVYASYLSILTKWVEAFFNKYDLNEIGDQTVNSYYDWLEKELERLPAKSTINHHNTVIRAVFDRAANDKVINRGDIPRLTIKGNGRPNQRRPHFDVDEIQEMMGHLSDYQRNADRFVTRYKRHLMRHYVAFLLETGMRPGLEVETLTWECVDEVLSRENKKCIRVWVRKGKRGHRKLIANDHASCTLGYLLNYRETLREIAFDRDWFWTPERAKKYHGQLIFAMPDGTPLTGVSEMFKRFLIQYGLYTTANGEPRSLYSCRHSFITIALLYKSLTVQEIAAQCGTSIEMISRHYSHVIPEMAADRLSTGIAHYLPYKL